MSCRRESYRAQRRCSCSVSFRRPHRAPSSHGPTEAAGDSDISSEHRVDCDSGEGDGRSNELAERAAGDRGRRCDASRGSGLRCTKPSRHVEQGRSQPLHFATPFVRDRVRTVHPVGAARACAGRFVCFGIVPDGHEHTAGIIQVRSVAPNFEVAEWGFAIGSNFWGRGVFPVAAREVMAFTFNTLRGHRVGARATVENGRGNGALQKIGATREGLLPPIVPARRRLLRPVDMRRRLAPMARRAAVDFTLIVIFGVLRVLSVLWFIRVCA
jgi:Acetyltransferase (GNAT) domain